MNKEKKLAMPITGIYIVVVIRIRILNGWNNSTLEKLGAIIKAEAHHSLTWIIPQHFSFILDYIKIIKKQISVTLKFKKKRKKFIVSYVLFSKNMKHLKVDGRNTVHREKTMKGTKYSF